MKILIIGAGAVGGFLGAMLNQAGNDVTLYDINSELVNSIRENGLTVKFSASGIDKHYSLKITDNLSSFDGADLMIICVKSYHTIDAIKNIVGILKSDTWILSVQNGAGNVEEIVSVVGNNQKVMGGVFLSSVTPIKINYLYYTYVIGGLKIGPIDNKYLKEVEKFADLSSGTELEIEITSKIQDVIWNKVLMNSINCVAAITGITNDEFLKYPFVKDLIINLTNECIEVMKAKEINFEYCDNPVKPLFTALENFKKSGNQSKASTLQDIEKGRKTEIDSINGMFVKEGKLLNVKTPINQTMVALIKCLEAKKGC